VTIFFLHMIIMCTLTKGGERGGEEGRDKLTAVPQQRAYTC